MQIELNGTKTTVPDAAIFKFPNVFSGAEKDCKPDIDTSEFCRMKTFLITQNRPVFDFDNWGTLFLRLKIVVNLIVDVYFDMVAL